MCHGNEFFLFCISENCFIFIFLNIHLFHILTAVSSLEVFLFSRLASLGSSNRLTSAFQMAEMIITVPRCHCFLKKFYWVGHSWGDGAAGIGSCCESKRAWVQIDSWHPHISRVCPHVLLTLMLGGDRQVLDPLLPASQTKTVNFRFSRDCL